MPNTNAPVSTKYRGWFRDLVNNTIEAYHGTTRFLSATASAVTVDLATTFSAAVTASSTLAVTGLSTLTGGFRLGAGASKLGLGAGEAVTLVSGVATVTKPYVILDAEGAGTTDTLDSITYTGQAAGDLLLLTVNATDTITADNSSTLLLGAATRAIAPGGCLLLIATSATVWVEIAFLTATS